MASPVKRLRKGKGPEDLRTIATLPSKGKRTRRSRFSGPFWYYLMFAVYFQRWFLFPIAENALIFLTGIAIHCKSQSSTGNSIDISIIKLALSNNLYFEQNKQYCSVYRVVFLYA